jgi:hypothetical protein
VQQRGGAAAWGARCSISSHGRRLVGEKIGENLHERIRLWWKMRWAPPCAVRFLLLRRPDFCFVLQVSCGLLHGEVHRFKPRGVVQQ